MGKAGGWQEQKEKCENDKIVNKILCGLDL
jgi:hypothetical protein